MAKVRASGWGETIRTVVYAVIIALAVRTLAYEPFNIPSGSMKPTLLVGDYLFVSKFSYGYSRYSLPFSLPLIADRILASEPERGDVIVFKLPSDNQTDYIKRLVGLPGDRIQVQGGVLHINGEAVKREQVTPDQTGDSDSSRVTQYIETLPNGVRHPIWEENDRQLFDDTKEYLVPPGHYFFMGDNRDRSQDSRAQNAVGFVPFENLVGRAEFLFYSHNELSWWQVWRWPTSIRWGRIFNGIG